MSVQAISWALSVKTGDPSAKVVLVALANYADDRGRCWPAQSTIAEQTEQSVDTIQRRLKDLENLGYVRRFERPFQNGKKGGLYFYHLLMPEVADTPPLETMPQTAARSETIPQTDENHAAKPSKPCRTAAALTTTYNHQDSTGSDFNGFEEKKESFKARPGSPEFVAWKSYATESKQRALVRELDQRELENRAFIFGSRWPPNQVVG